MGPTNEFYNAMLVAYDHFNTQLFNNKLPRVLFTTQRQIGVMGYFSPNRWASKEGKKCHEIAINPSYVGRATLIELLQTLVHEMAHCWQHTHGTPGRRGYHNKQWGDKMEKVGLMPSNTGMPGGDKTGEKMNDYPIPNGKFIKEAEILVTNKGFNMPWVDRLAHAREDMTEATTQMHHELEALSDLNSDALVRLTTNMGEIFTPEVFNMPVAAQTKTKTKYHCYGCNANLWGKPGLNIRCDDCDEPFVDY